MEAEKLCESERYGWAPRPACRLNKATASGIVARATKRVEAEAADKAPKERKMPKMESLGLGVSG